ncbi:MAG: hypothetical protein K2G60_05560 [Oscillospiraceae bacterium]|nr:hypothetical protein [Oscillospiraceae bacterium]
MELNDDNIPESKKKELLDMAYNVLPEGADYDVFSENTSKEVKSSLLYNDISSKPPEKLHKEKQKNEDEQKGSSANYDMFAENAGLNINSTKPINREYLYAIYKGGIEFSEDTVRMTRSDYIAKYNKVNEYYDSEKKKCQKNLLWALLITAFCVAVVSFLRVLLTSFEVNMVTQYLYRILFGLRVGAIVATLVVSGFFFASSIRGIKNTEKSRQKAISRLEQRKQELMVLGLYDLSNES